MLLNAVDKRALHIARFFTESRVRPFSIPSAELAFYYLEKPLALLDVHTFKPMYLTIIALWWVSLDSEIFRSKTPRLDQVWGYP